MAWIPNPRTSGGWVADPSHHLGSATVDSLNRIISGLKRETGAEIAVVVVDSTAGLTAFDFALELHRHWGVGERERDNGVLFLWVPTKREVFISVGYGLEGVLPDSRTGRIRDTNLFPYFRRNEFDRGVLETVKTLAAVIRAEPAQPRARGGVTDMVGRITRVAGEGVRGIGVLVFSAFGFLAATLLLGIPIFRFYRRHRPRRCPQCGKRMRKVSESEDDQKLVPGEIKEEALRSVDYDVWYCDTDAAFLKFRYPRWFSRYRKCPQCRYRTLVQTSQTVIPATTHSSGLERVIERCEFCSYQHEFKRSIPMIVVSSSGGGSGGGGGGGGGGGSFGGGSAGGGGAGGRY